jgi:Arc/MetJ family transcription regulator
VYKVRTNIVIDERLMEEAMKLARLKTKREVVQKALEEYVQDLKKRDLRGLKGQIRLAEGYDYKAARKR